MDRNLRLQIFKKASLCRNFEISVFNRIKKNIFKFPIYLSAGEEFIPATMSTLLEDKSPLLFAQHRAHSTYLCYGGDIVMLIDELLGRKSGCSFGMGGSASIQEKNIGMYGHDGLMGSQIPIAVGACIASKKLTVAIMGDASFEEDYVMSSIAWAGTKKLPIIFVVEDNNLSILTEKKIRRNWDAHKFSDSVNVKGFNIDDSPESIYNILSSTNIETPILLNVNTERLFWHAGAGIDNYEKIDRYKIEMYILGKDAIEIHNETKAYIEEIWEKRLEIQ